MDTADALLAAESFADGDACLTLNSDNYYPAEAYRRLIAADGPAISLFDRRGLLSGNIPAERLRHFAGAEIDSNGLLKRIIENPDLETWNRLAGSAWISMNCWRFGPNIFDACRRSEPSPRGEYELISAVQIAIDHFGEQFRAVYLNAPVLDLTSRADIPAVTAALAGMEVLL